LRIVETATRSDLHLRRAPTLAKFVYIAPAFLARHTAAYSATFNAAEQ
jgi:hypothetical protein